MAPVTRTLASLARTLSRAAPSFALVCRSLLNETFVEYAVRASLIDAVDKRVLVQLRDSKQFIGDLRSFDQVTLVG